MKKINLEVDEKGCIEVVFNTKYGGFGISKLAIKRMIELGSDEAKKCLEEHEQYGFDYNSYDPKVPRFDPILIQVVKELKTKANGNHARLAIGKININDLIEIDGYDGKEKLSRCYDYEIIDDG